ncbi:hypothetical protein PIROE2DRAFT_7931 [Piromyces sp. E2]|nr:hypothetical protein PIROE2DRAFT_7931 [Piromyces sp. E2]|eukprot:OUM65125.1 hypothetical protein PIROE2DRAFT_7931 [Piromyces sp. E2]
MHYYSFVLHLQDSEDGGSGGSGESCLGISLDFYMKPFSAYLFIACITLSSFAKYSCSRQTLKTSHSQLGHGNF